MAFDPFDDPFGGDDKSKPKIREEADGTLSVIAPDGTVKALTEDHENGDAIFERRLAAFQAAIDGFEPSAEQLAAVAEEAVAEPHTGRLRDGHTDFQYGAYFAVHGIGVRELLEEFPKTISSPEVARGYWTRRMTRQKEWPLDW